MILQTTKRRTSELDRNDVLKYSHFKTVFNTFLLCTESINHMIDQWMKCIFICLEILKKQFISADDWSSSEKNEHHFIRTLWNAFELIENEVSEAFMTACHVLTHQWLYDHLKIVFSQLSILKSKSDIIYFYKSEFKDTEYIICDCYSKFIWFFNLLHHLQEIKNSEHQAANIIMQEKTHFQCTEHFFRSCYLFKYEMIVHEVQYILRMNFFKNLFNSEL